MVEGFGEGRAFPGPRGGARQSHLVALEVPEQKKSPLAGTKICCHKRASAILGVDRRVQVDMGIRWPPRLGGHRTRSIWIHV